MSGTIYDEIKKKGDSKKREKLKFILTIISTNLLVLVTCLNFSNSSAITYQTTNKNARVLHPEHKMIIVPLTVLVDVDPLVSETPVSLMTKSKKILIARAYLHEEVKNSEKPGEKTQFKIEIPETDLLMLSADSEVEMIAIPELKSRPVLKPINKRVSQYEIDL